MPTSTWAIVSWVLLKQVREVFILQFYSLPKPNTKYCSTAVFLLITCVSVPYCMRVYLYTTIFMYWWCGQIFAPAERAKTQGIYIGVHAYIRVKGVFIWRKASPLGRAGPLCQDPAFQLNSLSKFVFRFIWEEGQPSLARSRYWHPRSRQGGLEISI